MDKLEELLPGIEEFLTNTLANEELSNFAEERRKYFVERLDIVNLPPSVPPREGRVLPLELLKETEQSSGVPADEGLPDFAATQREISRSFIEHVTDGDVASAQQILKECSDLDQPDRQDQDVARRRSSSENNPRRSVDNGNDNDSDDNENGLYEIPVTKQVSVDETSVSFGAENSSLATTGSAEELALESLDTSPGIPPPVPARRDRSVSDSRSRGSTNDEDDRPPDLPYRPPLPKRTEIYARSEKSDKSETEKSQASDPELSGDGDSTSYESFDEDKDLRDTDVANKYDVKLPKKPKKKTALRRNTKLRNTKSPLQSEIDVPFKKLDSINISGELLDRGKLKWNKRIVAISNGHMLVYKPEKGARPCLVIPLAGYEATVYEREGRRGCEVRMEHADGESHTFCLDLKEWAQIWTEHINGHAKGQPPPKYHTHLAGSFSDCGEFYNSSQTYGSKNDLNGSDAYSPAEADMEDGGGARGKRKKVTRMGSFAYRATQFLENISKKTSGRKKSSQSLTTCRHSSGDATDASTRPLRLHVPTSRSVGNLTKELMSPTSDSSATSVFGDNSASSPPPTPVDTSGPVVNPWEIGGNIQDVDIACKGHLSIFSTFNKRCWGKRWCLVKGNNFECYRNEQSRQCELSFPLKPCLLRRAVSETNSQQGLMLMEADKEKITVEPLSKYEMGQWVRVLLRETSTEGVPEGLEEFLQEEDTQDPPGSAETSRAVFLHEYEDPEETLAAVAQLKAQYQTQGTPVPAKADQNDNIVMGPDHSRNQVPDSKMLTSKYNQITDSGFYSVKETNSDSDSSCGNSSVHEKLEGGYATVDSPKYQRSSSSHKRSLEFSKNTAQGSSLPQVSFDNNHKHAIPPSHGLSASQTSARSSTPSVSTVHSNVSSSISHQQCNQITTSAYGDSNIVDSVSNLKMDEHQKQNSARSGIPRRSSQTVLSPSGEEYSIILKRSDRVSAYQSSSPECDISSPASGVKAKMSEKYDTGKCIQGDDISKFKHSIDAPKVSTADRSTKPLYFDPVISKRAMKTTVALESTMAHDSEGQKPNISKLQQIYAPSSDQPPPIPKSPVPSLHRDGRTFSVSIPMIPQTTERPRSSSCVVGSSQKQTIVNPCSSKEEDDSIPNVQESWAHLISKQNATVEELQTAIDSFKNKQVEIKRKRMAVHDKRQRVLSDEERLACEKEFAALEKLGECTDRTIRTLQNHLEHIQGHMLGAVKTAASSRHSYK